MRHRLRLQSTQKVLRNLIILFLVVIPAHYLEAGNGEGLDQAERVALPELSLTAPYGNHGLVSLFIGIDAYGFQVLETKFVNFVSETRLRMNLKYGYISVDETSAGEIQEHYTLRRGVAGYPELIERMQAHISYIVAADRYRWMGLSYVSLHPELNDVIGYLDEILVSEGIEPEPDCVLYNDEHVAQWTSFGGMYQSLGWWNDRAERVWVRPGYRLILLEHDRFDIENQESLDLVGAEAQQEFILADFGFSNRTSAFICQVAEL